MELYFLRHGLAGQHGDAKYKEDNLRPLTPEGKKKMQREAVGMKTLDLEFDAVLSSPYLRARQTADIVAKAFRIKKKDVRLTDNLLENVSVENLLQEIRHHSPKAKNVLLVGHEPYMTEMISRFLKNDRSLAIDLKKGGLACLGLEEPLGKTSAVLRWILTPGHLCLMSK
jgi:phosphohistidine phosphatase